MPDVNDREFWEQQRQKQIEADKALMKAQEEAMTRDEEERRKKK
ncbi:hypothetical protein [Nocardiopsis sp. CNT-189]